MGIQQIMLGTSPAGDTYWIKSDGVDTAGYKLEYNGVHVDTAGNVYTYGKTNDPWNTSNPWRYDRICFHKYDKHGTNVFYKRFSNNTNAQEPHYQHALVGLSDGSMIFTSRSNLASVKMNSSGSILHKKGYGTSSSSLDSNFTSISVNSSDQTLYTGYEATYNSGTINVFQINSNGTLAGDWQVSVTSSGNYGTGFNKTGTDSSGNVYIIGYRGQSGTYDKDGYIMKLNSSMVIQWQHTLGETGYYPINQWYDLAFDSNDNIYCVGTARTSDRHYGWIVKYNSSGTLQWQKKFGNGTQNLYFWSISIDDDDNIYCQGSVDLYGSTPFWVKLNTSGAVQYQRDLRESNNNANADWTRTMTVSGDALYIVGRRYIGYQKHFGWIIKVPKAGIDTGTYDNKYTISQPSYTMSNTSFTTDRVSAPSFTIADVTNKNTYNATYSVSTNSNPGDIKSAYDIVDD